MIDRARTVEEIQEVPGPSVTAGHHYTMVLPTSRSKATTKQDGSGRFQARQ